MCVTVQTVGRLSLAWRTEFNTTPVHVGFVVNSVAPGKRLLLALRSSRQYRTTNFPHPFSHHQRYVQRASVAWSWGPTVSHKHNVCSVSSYCSYICAFVSMLYQ